MSAQTASHDRVDPSGDERMKRLRLRKVYIELRIPRVKAEIAAIATRKKAMKESGEVSKHVIEEMIYNNQHMVALRKELQTLEQERKTVLKGMKDIRLQETGTAMPAAAQ